MGDKDNMLELIIYCKKCGYKWIEKVKQSQPKVKPCEKCSELVYLG
jgi:hypothetical protein